jgi:peptide/nickel transport system substrate-binding protein
MRRSLRRPGPLTVLVLAAVVVLVAGAGAQEQPRPGGVLKAAMIGEPPSLDLHTTTATITQQITWHVYETLYTFDKNFTPIPMLAEGHTIGEGGRVHTIRLRKGVRFHNGKEMTAADVVASLTRWGRVATPGKAVFANVEAVEAKDPYTVVFHLKQATCSLYDGLARSGSGAAIYPKEVVDAAGEGQVTQPVGTGPFRFAEHRPDRHIKLARFKDYAARSEAPDGYGGRRTAYVDEILFIPVPDVAVRLAGVETGEYHYGQQIKQDQFERMRGMKGVRGSVIRPYGWATAVINHKEGLLTDKRLRQAVQAALEMEPIMAAGFGHKEFYRIDPGLMFVEQGQWHSKAGAALYNQKDRAKTQRLLKEARYAGQPIRWITTREYEWMYKNAVVAKQQLEEAGFKVDLQVVDWATLVQRRNKPELYEIFSTGITFNPDPAFSVGVQCNWPGWWCHAEKNALMEGLARECDPQKRKAAWDKVQAIFYEDVGRIKFGDYFTLDAVRAELQGFRSTPELHFWNVWLK